MKFRIIWIDDSKTWRRSVEDTVKASFNDRQFTTVLEQYEDTASAEDSISKKYTDLILLDFNLPETNGDIFIKKLRAQRCFAQIIFYSEDKANLTSIHSDDHFIHVSHRSEIAETLSTVAESSYRKYRHPAFMRGLLLSEFIDLENLLDTFTSHCFLEQGSFFKEQFINKGGESFSLSAKFKFYRRAIKAILNSESKLIPEITANQISQNQFNTFVTDRRNILAHAYPQYDIGSGDIHLMSADKSTSFDSDWFYETREKIYAFKAKLQRTIDLNPFELINQLHND